MFPRQEDGESWGCVPGGRCKPPGVRGQGSGQGWGFRDREKSDGRVRGLCESEGPSRGWLTRGWVRGQMEEECVAWCPRYCTRGWHLDEGGRAWTVGVERVIEAVSK